MVDETEETLAAAEAIADEQVAEREDDEGNNNNGGGSIEDNGDKADDDAGGPQGVESPRREESEEQATEESETAEGDADPGPEEKQDQPTEKDEDDQPNGPTLQVSVDNPPDADNDVGNDVDDNDNDAANDADVDDVDDQAGPTLQFTFQQNPEDVQDAEIENEKPTAMSGKKRPRSGKTESDQREEYQLLNTHVEYEDTDQQTIADKKTVAEGKPESDLELALSRLLTGKENHVAKLTNEIKKLKCFISKRKQTYKRKRKDEGAPTRALSAYNIFVQDQFAKLAKKNSAALQSTDTNAQLERVPPANLVASTGGVWKTLPDSEKEQYRERAKSDRKRYDEQMAKYQPPDKGGNRKRNKTGYNMFFSAHVLRLKQSEMGVPSERGSVARLVGTAWKQLNAEEKQYYEREADKHNGMNPVEKAPHHMSDHDDNHADHDKDEKESSPSGRRQALAPPAMAPPAMAQPTAAHAAEQYHAAYPDLPNYAHAMAQQQHAAAAHHQYYYGHAPAHAYHYDYSGHAVAANAAAQRQSRGAGGQYPYAPQPAHYYDK